ncbi:hypothetical protein B0H63DRAFT_448727 [Podospora didyma]|uniref:Tat pathway signal sequence n=1 Tax=Podospora didyma TaxID=330526 RepID=A0AAE0U287_9PEZI|nr:hypothetical protein B0H63DRAFT_448727 [Podospora didyma]
MFSQARKSLWPQETPVAYESLRGAAPSDHKDDVKIETVAAEFNAQAVSRDMRTTVFRLRMATAVLSSLVVFMSLCWISREVSVLRVPVATQPAVSEPSGGLPYSTLTKTPEIFSPANVATEWKEVVFHNNFRQDRTKWQGPPNDDVDKAWEESYLGVGVIKIPKSDADRLPNQTLPIPGEDDGYIVGVEVFHQLHCLDLLRRHLYPDRYHNEKGMNAQQLKEYWIHLEHCIDNLRQTIMCYSDVSTIPWKIHEKAHREFPDAHTTHVCRDFDTLKEWMLDPVRHFPQEKYQLRVDALRAGAEP